MAWRRREKAWCPWWSALQRKQIPSGKVRPTSPVIYTEQTYRANVKMSVKNKLSSTKFSHPCSALKAARQFGCQATWMTSHVKKLSDVYMLIRYAQLVPSSVCGPCKTCMSKKCWPTPVRPVGCGPCKPCDPGCDVDSWYPLHLVRVLGAHALLQASRPEI